MCAPSCSHVFTHGLTHVCILHMCALIALCVCVYKMKSVQYLKHKLRPVQQQGGQVMCTHTHTHKLYHRTPPILAAACDAQSHCAQARRVQGEHSVQHDALEQQQQRRWWWWWWCPPPPARAYTQAGAAQVPCTLMLLLRALYPALPVISCW